MSVKGIDHIQLAMPRGGEDKARSFYSGLLGIPERPKPQDMAMRGGCWFEDQQLKLHLGIEEPFSPARKAHPALLVEGFTALKQALEAAGVPVTPDRPLDGRDRFFINDPFGNRIEIIAFGLES